MLKLSDLAMRPDFQLGPMLVSPARRLVQGPGGEVHLEPIIMHVFLMLLDGRGTVVTRNELFDQCWGGVVAGDDSLNRAIAIVRRTGAQVAPGFFEVETIPRTGYRVTGEILEGKDPVPGPIEVAPSNASVTRRAVIGGGIATAGALGATGLWWVTRPQGDPKVESLIANGKRILIDAWPGNQPKAVETLARAVALAPDSAEARGLLAYSEASALDFSADENDKSLEAAERTAKAALELDPNEPNALLTMVMLQRGMLGLVAREDAYRRVLAIAPDNVLALRSLAQMLHGVGRCRETYELGGRAIALAPMSPDLQMRNAMRLWVLERSADAYRVSNRTMELWSEHPLVRMARLMICAFTGRTRAALAIVKEEEATPRLLSPAAASVWRTSLEALERPSRTSVAAASKANIEGSQGSPAIAAYAILILSRLGNLDAAFEVANGFLLARGSIIVQPRPDTRRPRVNNGGIGWRNTFGLFTPPARAIRLDARFKSLCADLGLVDYWRTRGVGPDAFLFARQNSP